MKYDYSILSEYFPESVIEEFYASAIDPRLCLLNHKHANRCKEVWKDEVFPNVQLLLPKAVKDWESLVRSFKLRHKLVHGISSCGFDYAKERVDGAINAAVDIREICVAHKVDLDSRLPVRRQLKG
jgi:hypothetical protein